MVQSVSIKLSDSERLSARLYQVRPGTSAEARLILGHGAGAGQDHAFLVTFSEGLAERGLEVVTFNFPYMEAGRRYPDSAGKLEDAYAAVIDWAAGDKPLFAGGKSMGGRIASQVAARPGTQSEPLAGLVFLGYPLHPPGKPEQPRSAHLPAIRVPMLFCQGSRDAFGTSQEIREAVRLLPSAVEIYEVDEGDHSFHVPKRRGVTQQEVYAAVMEHIARWTSAVIRSG